MSERKGTKALELWCKRLVKDCPDVQIDNMTTSWRNGIAFCALVHHFRPDLIDMSSLHLENVYDNNKLAFSVAEKHLGIPSLLDPEDMVANEVPDRLSILTYLSQFYQRLGHTVNTKTTETDSKASSPSATQSLAPFKFGKAGLDKCAACGLPVYLAQRLIASHKLYHRRCFRCSKCSGHLNPKNFNTTDTSDFFCDSCKNEKTFSKFLNNNDQMGMLAFSDNLSDSTQDTKNDESISPITRSRPPSILEKISMFENNTDKSTSVENKVANLSLKENFNNKSNDLSSPCDVSRTSEIKTESFDKTANDLDGKSTFEQTSPTSQSVSSLEKNIPNKEYKTSINKFNFLQTQLQGDSEDTDIKLDCSNTDLSKHDKDVTDNNLEVNISSECGDINNSPSSKTNVEKNLTDDTRLAESQKETPLESNKVNIQGQGISVPPRRKKQNTTPEHVPDTKTLPKVNTCIKEDEYPDDLNPFSDSDDEHEVTTKPKKISTNPFGSSDEEDDDVPPIQLPPKVPTVQNTTPAKRHIIAYNPFWSDGEEPSSDDEQIDEKSMCSSPLTTSTPAGAGAGAGAGGARRKKARAPPPPAILLDSLLELPATSLDDVASISSLSSYNSTAHSDHKSFGKLTPHMKKKRLAPTPPDSISTVSNAGSMERGLDAAGIRNISDGNCRRVKGPAPGLPLPERREVKMMITPEELQVQLDLLETQQLGLERQGVLVEQMIRDKCEGDEPSTAPQEEVEDLVIQLCELVNEKNDLFRKQTELMYLRRQQRLEQEQADIEHEIRVIQSRPAVNRIDADKAREEQLVARLVQVVRLRDELVQQLDAERRRERQEDRAIAASIAAKRAQRNSESNSSSMKSVDVVATPKKSKVKDKVKKQLKKAKHTMTFISKKKEDSGDRKEEKSEKEKKTK